MIYRQKNDYDYGLMLLALTLMIVGIVMVYSASAIWADQHLDNPWYFVKKQIFWAVISVAAMSALSRFNYNRLSEWTAPIILVTALTLTAALFGSPVAGVRRWIRLGPIGLQPSEFAKLASVIFLAYYLDRRKSKLDSPWRGLGAPMTVVGVLLFLISLEPDLGTPALMFAVAVLVLFIGGGNLKYLFGLMLASLPVLAYELVKYPYRRARLLDFLNPFENAHGAGYQLAQSILAVGSGGWLGKGIGGSKIKLMYLPTPHTDFIFPVLCEELGLLGGLGCLALFVLLLIRGVKIARQAPNLFGSLLAAGITFTICLQAFFNMGMSIGMLPTKGIPLPFISFGGSSLLATLCGIGILLNISRQASRRA
jgi:cell division protein FtsW